MRLHVEYPEVNKVLSKLDYNKNTFDGFGINIGYLCKDRDFKEYRIADNDEDGIVKSIIDDMVSDIIDYGLPYFDKYSTIDSAISGMETNKIDSTALSPKCSLPLFYLTKGWYEAAIIYVKNMEEQILKAYEGKVAECVELREILGNENVNIPCDSYYKEYQHFAKLVSNYAMNYGKLCGTLLF